jgi:hypothetical protein
MGPVDQPLPPPPPPRHLLAERLGACLTASDPDDGLTDAQVAAFLQLVDQVRLAGGAATTHAVLSTEAVTTQLVAFVI